GVVFDGEHWAWPKIDGEQVFGNPVGPGWARQGSFADPRQYPYGPLPREHAHWRGLYLHGRQVILSYTVGDMSVLERPGLVHAGGLTAFDRVLNLGPTTHTQAVQVAFLPGGQLEVAPAGETGPGTAWLRPAEETAALRTDPDAGLLVHLTADDRAEPGADAVHPDRPWRLHQTDHAAKGHTGGALRFDGQGWLQAPAAAQPDFLRQDVTVAAWIRTEHDGTILSLAAPEGPWVPNGKTFFIRGGKLAFDIGWVGAVNGSRKVADDRWHHVALVYRHENGAVRLYVDGRPDAEGELRPKAPLPGEVLRLGFTAPNFPRQPWFRGLLDEVRVYGRALGSAEIARLAGRPAMATGILTAAVLGDAAGAVWLTDSPEHLRLQLPPSKRPRRLRLLLWRGEARARPAFDRLARSAEPPPDLSPLTRGGPPRWQPKLVTHGQLGSSDGPYAVDKITAPEDNPWHSWIRFGGVDFFSDLRRAALCTWSGDVWVVEGIDGNLDRLSWQRIATGLFQPLGLKIVDDQIYVLGRDQITRLHDLNGDGEADFYENFNNDCMVSEHFHEFATDLKTDAEGNFWYIKCACHAIKAKHPHHGTVLKLPPDGSRLEVVARGLRAVNGLGIGPHGEILCIDNQGHWMPANRINWVEPGGWYGNQNAWNPDNRQTYDEPLCWIHNFVDRSGGTFLWVPDRRWGPGLEGRIISISYGMGYITEVLVDQVDGIRQGAVTRFPMDFETGVMRGVFHPINGQLYTCGLFGWSGNRTKPGGFYRVRYTGQPVLMANRFHVAADGLVLGFTDPLDPAAASDPRNYSLQAWNYRWTGNYGSPDFKLNGEKGRDTWTVAEAVVSADRRSVFLRVPEIQPVMQFHLVFNLRSAQGEPIRNFLHGTIHRTGHRTGREVLGETAGAAGPASAPERPALEQEAPGLLQELTSLTRTEQRDHRVVRLPATHVPAGRPPSPWLDPGPFRSVWRGHLKLGLTDDIRFRLTGRGRAVLRLGDRTVLEAGPGEFDVTAPKPVTVYGGLNRFELEYVSPADGDAFVRLGWQSETIPPEPVPATAFVHDAALAEARQAVASRQGRALFGRHLCARCHQPETPWGPEAMPELEAAGPELDGLGDRLQAAWLVDYLQDPRGSIPDTAMPRLLDSDPARAAAQAADLAAFLLGPQTDSSTLQRFNASTLQPSNPPTLQPFNPSTTLTTEGDRWFTFFGCFGCHRLEGMPALPDDPRLSLAHVPPKWRPAALTAFLRDPARLHPWSRMPTFPLSEEQARALTARLLSQPVAAEGRASGQTAARVAGDPDRGRALFEQLGCAACHHRSGTTNRLAAPRLAELSRSGWDRGCMADSAAGRGRAPDFGFTSADRRALAAFASTAWVESLTRRAPDEFAERQIAELRCNACHSRDGRPDVWTAVEALGSTEGASAADSEDEPEGSVHLGRPLLSFTGEKLHAEWMRRFLTGRLDYKPRPVNRGYMPAFPAQGALIADGLAQQHGYGPVRPPRPEPDPDLAAIGERLTRVGDGFGCISCHDIGDRPALAGQDTAAINFAFIADRLLPDYYWRYLQDPQRLVPGTMMPAFIGADGRTPIREPFDGDPHRQFGAIWQFLLSLDPGMAKAIPPAATPPPAAPDSGGYE
ncbi:MAG: hypothetical protein D6766_08540, partial [Verrucomicrobia bacterium]